ncbi:peptide-methionine (S)-S-oxide reductase [Salinibacter ruber]|uniref:peptide-methionine (S)-S-oxide reductase n=1 Tax=Salinibacter ruber TaxID=146919 RepID=UPI002167FC56|nr:peptide-methionine (S)-S-oxide reductase [Salinibacter ruber]
MDQTAPTDLEAAVVALGCFWNVEAAFGALDGVVRTTVGYAGGQAPDPAYATLGDHAEAVRVEYAPARLRYTALLDRFWSLFDPTLTPAKRRYQPPARAPERRAGGTGAGLTGRRRRAGRAGRAC